MKTKKVNSDTPIGLVNPCSPILRSWPVLTVVVVVALLPMILVTGGCSNGPTPSPYPKAYSMAIVPFRNLSGSQDLSMITITDMFYSELQQVPGQLQVMPNNRVLSALSSMGLENVHNPEEVMMLADTLGVDAVVVGSVTQYDPYRPPKMGMIVQLYIREQRDAEKQLANINPGEIARMGNSFNMPAGMPMKPRAEVVRIFDAGKTEVIDRVKKYHRGRDADPSPSGWEKCLTSTIYPSFVCHEMIDELLAQESSRLAKNE